MNITRVLISGIIIWIIGWFFGWLTCGWLFSWVYTIPPNIWKDPSVMMSSGSIIVMNLICLISALIFAFVYALLYKGIPGTGVKKGLVYGFLVWLVGALTGLAGMPLFMTIAITVIIYWIIQALVIGLINGVIVGFIYKER